MSDKDIEFKEPISVVTEDALVFKLSSGTTVRIPKYYRDFYDKLLTMTPQDKIDLLGLDLTDIETYIKTEKAKEIDLAKSLLSKKWVCKAEGIPFYMDLDYDIFNGLTGNEMLKLLKSKKATVKDARMVINIFNEDNKDWINPEQP